MFKTIKKLFKNDEGQALVLVALALVVLLGFAAITIDYGYLAWQKRSLQNAADSAALAAAWELPNDTEVRNKAREFAKKNSSELTNEEINHTILNGGKEVKVDLKYTYNTFLGGILGSSSQEISASATAEKLSKWSGEALPFINLTDDYTDINSFKGWTDQGPGYKGTTLNFNAYNMDGNSGKPYTEIDYEDGIPIENGFSGGNEGLNGVKIKDAVEAMLKDAEVGQVFYMFSIRKDLIEANQVDIIEYKNKNDKIGTRRTVELKKLNSETSGDFKINADQFVLIEVTFLNHKNYKEIGLAFEKEYDIMNGEFPTENLNSSGDSSRLTN